MRKERNGEICYEIKFPRTLAGIKENAATFFVNVKRIHSSQICGELYKNTLGAVTLGKEGTKNGSFADVEKTKSGRKNILSATFPKYWGFAGTEAALDEKKVSLFLKGVIYQFMGVSGGEKGGILKVEVKAASAAGKDGSIRPYLSLCVRKPGDRGGFRHDIKKYGKKLQVTGAALYNFAFELAPCENGYIYLDGQNVTVESISAAFEENK